MIDVDFALACQNVRMNDLHIMSDEAAYLEESTKLQATCSLWHKYRINRITASKFAAVKRARLSAPPNSLIKALMG